MTLLEDFIMNTKPEDKSVSDQWLYEKLKEQSCNGADKRDFFNMWTSPKDQLVKLPTGDTD